MVFFCNFLLNNLQKIQFFYKKIEIEKGLNMIIVPVFWVSFDFHPCVKKNLKYIPVKKKLFEKGPWPHYSVDLAWFWPRGSC